MHKIACQQAAGIFWLSLIPIALQLERHATNDVGHSVLGKTRYDNTGLDH
jgi:hypothetical protein